MAAQVEMLDVEKLREDLRRDVAAWAKLDDKVLQARAATDAVIKSARTQLQKVSDAVAGKMGALRRRIEEMSLLLFETTGEQTWTMARRIQVRSIAEERRVAFICVDEGALTRCLEGARLYHYLMRVPAWKALEAHLEERDGQVYVRKGDGALVPLEGVEVGHQAPYRVEIGKP